MRTYMVRIIYDKGRSQRYVDTIRLADSYTSAFADALKHAEIGSVKVRQVLIHELRH